MDNLTRCLSAFTTATAAFVFRHSATKQRAIGGFTTAGILVRTRVEDKGAIHMPSTCIRILERALRRCCDAGGQI